MVVDTGYVAVRFSLLWWAGFSNGGTLAPPLERRAQARRRLKPAPQTESRSLVDLHYCLAERFAISMRLV